MPEITYIWINPVTTGMYDPEALAALLRRHRCVEVHCQGDWVTEVRRKYLELTEQTDRVVSDARCPMAAALVRELQQSLTDHPLEVAEVDPILIHAARELSQREDLRDGPKLITTPCAALAELGNALHLENTRFCAWKELLAQWGETPAARTLSASPIPPGFFDGTGLAVRKLTGKDEIAAYVNACLCGEEQLAEMLYCKDGCHNGDGVVWDE